MKSTEFLGAKRRYESADSAQVERSQPAASKPPSRSTDQGQTRSRRIPVAPKKERPGAVASASRNLFASRTRRGPILVPCEKAMGLQGCESALESLVVAAARFDDRVERVVAQPRVMDVRTGITGRTTEVLKANLLAEGYAWKDAKLWYVDLELHLVEDFRPVLVEVKPEARAAAMAAELAARRAACERVGLAFMLVRDEDFPEPLAHNVHILRRYAGTPVSDETTGRILQALSTGAHTAVDLARFASAGLAEVYGLVARGVLVTDLVQERLGPQATLSRSAGEPRKILPLP